MRIPVLTYHGVHVDGSDYANNDHIGLYEDLQRLQAERYTIVSLSEVAKAVVSGNADALPQRAVAITFDDGSWFDWHDLQHPTWGKQRSMRNILRDFRHQYGADVQPHVHATNFVIVSPEARAELDRSCLIGQGWWGDKWWADAHTEGLMSIANHSWDHRHSSLPAAMQFSPSYGNFHDLDGERECVWQIEQAQDYLVKVLGQPPALIFAYPYGDAADLLADDYLPLHHQKLGLIAAADCTPEPVTLNSNRWRLPRFMFRRDWSEPDELLNVLEQ